MYNLHKVDFSTSIVKNNLSLIILATFFPIMVS